MYWPQNVSRDYNLLIRSIIHEGGPGNPFAPIGFNGKSATNFRSSSAMRGAEFHGNSGRDGTTRILSIVER